MKQTYAVSGMTCGGCVASVTEKLSKVDGVEKVEVHLEKGEAKVYMQNQVPLSDLKAVLPQKYTIEAKEELTTPKGIPEVKTKFQQLQPLFLIFAYLFSAAILLNYQDWNTQEAMLDFMGLFYVDSHSFYRVASGTL